MNPTNSTPLCASLLIGALTLPSSNAAAQFILGEPTNLGEPIETPANELAPELSADGLTMYFQKGNYNDFADIYVSKRDSLDSAWQDPQPIESINTRRHEASPAVSPDGRELYFDDGHRAGYPALTRAGGLGGPDIWISSWNAENNTWGEPSNLGAPVNSRYRDYAPNLSADGSELYFSSDRPGGSGNSDIWVTKRSNPSDPWSEPVNLSVNSNSHDERPAVSPDGLTLIFGSTRSGGRGLASDLWMSTREHIDDDWAPPVHLGNELNGPYWTFDPEFSPDGGTLYYGRFDQGPGNTLWKVPLLPLEKVSLAGGGATYVQDFDEALSTDATLGQTLPSGWAVTENGVIFENTTTRDFPNGRPGVMNAGQPQEVDRALAVGVRSSSVPSVELLAQTEDSDAAGLQIAFDVEAWSAARVTTLGEAAFDVIVELDSGEGFSPLADLGRVTTGATLFPPAGDIIDGNSRANRVEFDSGVIDAKIPQGSQLRFRWAAAADAQTSGWVFGLDNVRLSLLDGITSSELVAGDADQDLDFDQLDLVQVQVAAKYLTGQAASWGDGDWDGAPGGSAGSPPAGDGVFNQFDVIAANLAGVYLQGPYAAIKTGGRTGDDQVSLVYNADTGEVAVDAPAGVELTSINIDSAADIFTGEAAANLGGSFDNDGGGNIFKATFGGSFGSVSFGNVAEAGLAEDFLLSDLSVVGSLQGGGALGDVDLVYVPEPTSALLLGIGIAVGLLRIGRAC